MVLVRVQCPFDGCDGMGEFETDPEGEIVAREKGHVELDKFQKVGKQLLSGSIVKEEHLQCPVEETHRYTVLVEL
ncbi:hypothetical protein ACFFQF_11990 [Haladaptatus pallidirubidus]|uniref:Uncharacterized protein n=1 Tax=Haladaptatus pallidirubidus TaxID=1008152 RepID=A0AAV3UDR7_9EURY|nr:hypothetical protein [Haladaptatus pallidirubidus]